MSKRVAGLSMPDSRKGLPGLDDGSIACQTDQARDVPALDLGLLDVHFLPATCYTTRDAGSLRGLR